MPILWGCFPGSCCITLSRWPTTLIRWPSHDGSCDLQIGYLSETITYTYYRWTLNTEVCHWLRVIIGCTVKWLSRKSCGSSAAGRGDCQVWHWVERQDEYEGRRNNCGTKKNCIPPYESLPEQLGARGRCHHSCRQCGEHKETWL
jgi:hypothetical protein